MGFFDFLTGGSVSKEELTQLIKDDALLVDVRTPAEYASGTAGSAINIPLDRVQANLDRFKNQKHIIVFCRSGARSNQAKMILQQNGFNNVTNGGSIDVMANLI